MSAFELTTLTKAKLASVNICSERHGADLVPAVDIKLMLESSNDILSKFDPDLLACLYCEVPPTEPKQENLDGVEPVSALMKLKYPKLSMPLKWEHSGTGYELTIDYGLGGDSNLVLGAAAVNSFAFDLKEGGTVELSLRIQASGVSEAILGKLAGLVQHDIHITLTAPKLEDGQGALKPMESPFLNSDPQPLTPEGALAGAVGGEAAGQPTC